MTTGRLNADIDGYLRAAGTDVAPPVIPSDPLVTGSTPIEQLLRVLGLATNSGDPRDIADGIADRLRRDTATTAAADAFAIGDDEAAAALADVSGPDPAAAMTQQLPQALTGVAAAVSGALGGILQSLGQIPQQLGQIPQQLGQGAYQAIQSGIGLLPEPGDGEIDPVLDDEMPEFGEIPSAADDLASLDGGGSDSWEGPTPLGADSAMSFGGTVPSAVLGPPPVPSPVTAPASAPAAPVTPGVGATHIPAGGAGFAGMPMVPPAALGGTPLADKEDKADTKRVAVPPVRNGAPVQGRLTPPSPQSGAPATTKPVTVRRIVVDDGQPNPDARPGS